jgi:hypothetical protein
MHACRNDTVQRSVNQGQTEFPDEGHNGPTVLGHFYHVPPDLVRKDSRLRFPLGGSFEFGRVEKIKEFMKLGPQAADLQRPTCPLLAAVKFHQ